MSESICNCSHGKDDHDFKKNENDEFKRPCVKCDCGHFQRPYAASFQTVQEKKIAKEYAAKKQLEEEEKRKKLERLALEEEEKRKKSERLELELKEQQRLERLERERKEKELYMHQNVFHICHIKNLSSIIEKGLFSRVLVKTKCPGFVDIANLDIVSKRRESRMINQRKLVKFASTYFEPINAMYFNETLGRNSKKDIVIVEFGLDLNNSGIVITDGNAANNITKTTNWYYDSFLKIMREIKKQTIDTPHKYAYQFPGKRDNPEYREQMRRHQAECLVPEEISRDCIKSIHISDDSDTHKRVKSCIDSSGLTINLKTMKKHQNCINRE